MNFITNYQLHLLISLFAIGCLGTAVLFRKPAGHRAWKLADLVWILLGGIGALVAIIAGLYTSDSSKLDRQIDIAYTATYAFDRDAARFRFRYCEGAVTGDQLHLCEKVEFLSASTAANAELPLFISLTDRIAPLTKLSFLVGSSSREQRLEMQQMATEADAFELERFLVFTPLDKDTKQAVDRIGSRAPTIAADYLIIAQSYDQLIEKVTNLKQEWEFLHANAHILVLQILALCLVSFAAPFRLGKSIVELTRKAD